MTTSTIDVRPVDPEHWQQLAEFFGPSGAYSGCWCAWWRRTAAEFDTGCRDGARGNRAMLQDLTSQGRRPGLLAYDGVEPVGWVSVAPRPEYGRILRSPTLKPSGADRGKTGDTGVWAVVCLWVPRAHRGRGVATVLLAGAVEHARASGASALEGYPVDVGARAPAADIFTGTLAMFLRAGFSEATPRASGSRVVVRLGFRDREGSVD